MKKSPQELYDFLRNAEFFLSDAEKNPELTKQPLFWDTADVKGALMGMAEFYREVPVPGRYSSNVDIQQRSGCVFQEQEFSSKATLVRCLMSARWFGRVHMLKPHEAEFHQGMSNEDLVKLRNTPVGGPEQFFRDAFTHSLPGPTPIRELSSTHFEDIVRQETASAERLYCAVESAELLDDRLNAWKQSRLLAKASEDQFDYGKTLASKEFILLKSFLDDVRNTGINNFTDAMALCQLNWYLRAALLSKQPLPLFFASDSTVRTALHELKDNLGPEFLSYRNASGEVVSIMRSHGYYLMRASLLAPSEGSEAPTVALSMLRQMCDEAREEVMTSDGGGPPHDLDALNDLHDIRDALAEKIDRLERLWFLDRVWLESAPTRMAKLIAKHAASKPYMQGTQQLLVDENRSRLRIQIADLTEGVGQKAKEFASMQRTWAAIEKASLRFRSQQEENGGLLAPSAKLSGVVRFGLNPEQYQEMDRLLEHLVSEQAIVRQSAVAGLTANVVVPKTIPESDLTTLGSTLGVLWILDIPNQVRELSEAAVQRAGTSSPAWLLMIYGAALLKQQRADGSKIREVIALLEQQLDGSIGLGGGLQAATALGYLNFHIWFENGGVTFWQAAARPQNTGVSVFYKSDALQEAIQYANKAVGLARRDTSSYVYALNQYVYYITEGASSQAFRALEPRAYELLSYAENKAVWNVNYTDTLARYFHRAALMAESEARWKDAGEFWGVADHHSRRAATEAAGDNAIQTHSSLLARRRPPSS